MPLSARPLRVALVEDDELLRALLLRTLAAERGIDVVADCADGEQALARLDPSALDVVLLDIDLGDGPTGIEVGRRLRAAGPGLGVVLLSNHRVPRALGLLAAPGPPGPTGPAPRGGLAYLLKGSIGDVGAIVRSLRAAAAGDVALDAALAHARDPRPGSELAALTPRQRDVLRLLAAGYVNGAIGDRLGLSEKTVENQLNAIYRVFGLDPTGSRNRRVAAVLRYLEQSAPALADGP